MLTVKECIKWMMDNELRELATKEGDSIAYFESESFYFSEYNNGMVCAIDDFSMFDGVEWIPKAEKIELEKQKENEFIKNASPEFLLSDWLLENADDYMEGSFVRGDELWEDMYAYMYTCGIKLVKAIKED